MDYKKKIACQIKNIDQLEEKDNNKQFKDNSGLKTRHILKAIKSPKLAKDKVIYLLGLRKINK